MDEDEDDERIAEMMNTERPEKTTKKENCARPELSYAQLIAEALTKSGEGALSSHSIMRHISREHPFFRMDDRRWQHGVRCSLSKEPNFRQKARGKLWSMEVEEEKRPSKECAPTEKKHLEKKTNKRKKEKLDAKRPSYHAQLIAEAILQSEEGMLPAKEIFEYITRKYPHFKREHKSWKQVIRNSLYRHNIFQNVERTFEGRGGKVWRMKDGAERYFKSQTKANERDKVKAITAMKLKTLRVDVEDIGMTLVPKLLAVWPEETQGKEGRIISCMIT